MARNRRRQLSAGVARPEGAGKAAGEAAGWRAREEGVAGGVVGLSLLLLSLLRCRDVPVCQSACTPVNGTGDTFLL